MSLSSLSVLVIEQRTYLDREMTATLRPWLVPDGESPDALWQELLEHMGVECLGETRLLSTLGR